MTPSAEVAEVVAGTRDPLLAPFPYFHAYPVPNQADAAR